MGKRKYAAVLLVALVAAFGLWGCDSNNPTTGDDKLDVVATTTMLEDLVEQLGGEHVRVHGLVSVGADPHVYQPTPGDARLVAESDAVVMNGLLLEGWMESLVRNAGGERPVIVGGDAIDEGGLIRVEGAIDPHVWFDVSMWRKVNEEVAQGLVELAGDDEEAVEYIRRRQAEYDATLAELDEWVTARMATVPEGRRVLITSHDAFNYFGRAYDVRVEAVQGLSTEQEASQRDVINVIELVHETEAPAVFTETSVNPDLIEQVARETGAARVGPLYSDSVGPEDSGAHTYVGMVQANVKIITEALGGDYEEFAGVPVVAPEAEEGDDA